MDVLHVWVDNWRFWKILVKSFLPLNLYPLYHFIFTTDEKPTVVYSILDRIPTTLAFSHVNWCKIDVFTLNGFDVFSLNITKIQND